MRFGAFVATFRRPSILGKTIELILEQTHPPEIILVVDNASCKDTESVARNFPQDRVVYDAMPENLEIRESAVSVKDDPGIEHP